MTWTLRDAKRERRITDQIDKGDDRSAGVLAGAFIQDRLIKAIKARMIEDTKVHSLVFKAYGPLADFRAQIDVAYLLGIIISQLRDYLHIIREIRNRFARRFEAESFDAQLISDLCDKLFHIPSIRHLKEMNDKAFSDDSAMKSILSIWLSSRSAGSKALGSPTPIGRR